MEQSWIVASGRLSLYLYYALIVASLLGIAYRRASQSSEARPAAGPDKARRREVPGAGALRFALEYVGNVGPEELRGRIERRRNREARALMDYIRGDLAMRKVEPPEAERLLEELRKTVRAERQEQTG